MLDDFIQEWLGKPLEYGKYDCAQMAAAWVNLKTGVNPLKGWKKYTSLETGIKTFKAKGFDNFTDAVTSKLTPLENNYFAMTGDIVAIKSENDNFPALGIFIHARSYLFFIVDNDIDGNVIEGSEQVRVLDAADYLTGQAWRVG